MAKAIQSDQVSLAGGLALIFDMDGVILDSNPTHRLAWAAFNRRYGLETTEAMHQRMYGKRNDQIVRDFYGEELSPAEVTARGAAKEELYREMTGSKLESMLVPGIREFLEFHRDVPKGLASNAEPLNVEYVLDRSGLRGYFKAIVTGQEVEHPKPHPEIYLRVAKHLGIEPANCIVFEDSESGVSAARAAGMRIVLVCTTHGNLPGASLSVDNFLSGELNPWLAGQGRVM